MILKRYVVYKLQGYDFYDKEKDLYMNVIHASVIADNPNDAIEITKKRLPEKKHFRIIECNEYVT